MESGGSSSLGLKKTGRKTDRNRRSWTSIEENVLVELMFNLTTDILDCQDDCWERIVKADPNATNMCFKAWPHYDDWNEIFGTDRANRQAVEDVVDAAKGILNENMPDVVENVGNPTDPAPADSPIYMDVASEAPVVDNSSAAKLSGKKRVIGDLYVIDRLCDVLG
ncbi:hypothetical protein ACS0TY_002706 [Phlomoides rotata]